MFGGNNNDLLEQIITGQELQNKLLGSILTILTLHYMQSGTSSTTKQEVATAALQVAEAVMLNTKKTI